GRRLVRGTEPGGDRTRGDAAGRQAGVAGRNVGAGHAARNTRAVRGQSTTLPHRSSIWALSASVPATLGAAAPCADQYRLSRRSLSQRHDFGPWKPRFTAASLRPLHKRVKCSLSVHGRLRAVSRSWFEKLTGVAETSPEQVRAQLKLEGDELVCPNGQRIACGTLELPTLGQLRSRAERAANARTLSVRQLVADVRQLHA